MARMGNGRIGRMESGEMDKARQAKLEFMRLMERDTMEIWVISLLFS